MRCPARRERRAAGGAGLGAPARLRSLRRPRRIHDAVRGGEKLESAPALGRLDDVDELLGRIDAIPPGKRPPFLAAEAARFRARVASARGAGDGVEQGFKTASAIFREHGLTFFLAVTQLEHGEWLGVEGRGDEAEPLLAEAREVFERLEAAPWLERADAVQPGLARIGAEAS
jgi:hypothetical protein